MKHANIPRGRDTMGLMEKTSDGARGKQSDLYAPDVLGDDLLGAVREVEVDEIGEQSHGDDEGRARARRGWLQA
jgi:hypothetical protein